MHFTPQRRRAFQAVALLSVGIFAVAATMFFGHHEYGLAVTFSGLLFVSLAFALQPKAVFAKPEPLHGAALGAFFLGMVLAVTGSLLRWLVPELG